MVEIRAYQPGQDEAAVAALWRAALPAWPLSPALRRSLLAPDPSRSVLVASVYGRLAGLVVAESHGEHSGSLPALAVAPEWQRRGIGAKLHAAALDFLRAQGVGRVQLAGGHAFLWPGVPYSLPAALPFFQAQGWRVAETSYDMVQHLGRYRTPAGVHERAQAQGVRIGLLAEHEAPELLAFVDREFPFWSASYRLLVEKGEWADCLLARTRDGAMAGSLILYAPRYSRPERQDVRWQSIWGEDLGAMGVVGVAESARRLGIGSALAARASEILRERGVGYCYIAWTWALDFYGKLGYTVWQAYAMSWRDLHTGRS